MKRRASQKWATTQARGEDCLIRLPSICNHNAETTVPCHYRLAGNSGMGFIPDEILVAFGCSACHAYVDTHHDDQTQRAFAEGVFRTQVRRAELGKLT